MKAFIRAILAGLLACAAASAASAAAAQPPAVPAAASPERDEAAARLMHVTLRASGLDPAELVKPQVHRFELMAKAMKVRPEWAGMFRTAFAEELDQDAAELDLALSHPYLDGLSLEELRAGLSLLAADAPRNRTPEQQAFSARFARLPTLDRDQVREVSLTIVVPGALRRFARMAETADQNQPTPPLSEKEQKATEVIRLISGMFDLREDAAAGFKAFDTRWAGSDLPPHWPVWLREAISEEMTARLTDYFLAMAKPMAGRFSDAELDAALAFMRGPGGQGLAQLALAKRSGAAPPTPTAEQNEAMERFFKSPDGASFMRKFGAGDYIRAGDPGPFLAKAMPNTLLRFADKIEADWKARRGAS